MIRNFCKFINYSTPLLPSSCIIKTGNVSARKSVPDHIVKPSYYKNGEPEPSPTIIERKTNSQIDSMRRSCIIARDALNSVQSLLRIGLTTDAIDTFLHNYIIEHGAYPSPLNYNGFPKSVCTSVNNVACHGIPDDRPLQDGDIITIDVTVFADNHHGDCSKTFVVGANVETKSIHLLRSTEYCLYNAVQLCKPGIEFRQIGALIERLALALGYTVIPAFAGHGIGSYFHGPPDILHTRNSYEGVMQSGMTFTIEPVLSEGKTPHIDILSDGWTAITTDNSRTAQFEHTVLITEHSVEILTK